MTRLDLKIEKFLIILSLLNPSTHATPGMNRKYFIKSSLVKSTSDTDINCGVCNIKTLNLDKEEGKSHANQHVTYGFRGIFYFACFVIAFIVIMSVELKKLGTFSQALIDKELSQ